MLRTIRKWIQWLGNRPQFKLLLLLLIVVPIGGGSIMAGTALAAAHFSPGRMVFAADPELADDAFTSPPSCYFRCA